MLPLGSVFNISIENTAYMIIAMQMTNTLINLWNHAEMPSFICANITKIKNIWSQTDAEKLLPVFITYSLDYCNKAYVLV